jgi:hypothetical protein
MEARELASMATSEHFLDPEQNATKGNGKITNNIMGFLGETSVNYLFEQTIQGEIIE